MTIIKFSIYMMTVFAVLFITACSHKVTRNNTPIPQSCLESAGKFQFVTGIVGSRSYMDTREFYSPIKTKGGFIKTDFNHDGVSDYIFLDRNPSQASARLITCASKKTNVRSRAYQRRQTPYLIREYKKLTNYVEYSEIKMKAGILSIKSSNHAHNDGGDGETAFYRYDNKQQDFVLTKFQYSAYGAVFPEIFQQFDLVNKRYKEETGCSFADNLSAMGYNPKCKPQKINRCLSPIKPQTIRIKNNRSILKKLVTTTAC